MTPDNGIFKRLVGDNQFKTWLDAEREQQINYLIGAVEPHMFHRAQGRLKLIEEMLALLQPKR